MSVETLKVCKGRNTTHTLLCGEMSVETLKDILTAGTPVYCIVAMFLYWLVIGY